MVQSVRIPLEWANVLPGVVGVEDVEFSIPELSDIEAAIDDLTIDLPDVEALLEGFIDDVVAEVQAAAIDTDQLVQDFIDEVETQLSNIVLDAETVADAVVDQLNLEDLVSDQVNISGIFGPLTEDVVRAFEDILNEVLGAIDDLPEDFTSITQAIDQVIQDTEELLARLPADFGQAVQDAVRALLEDLPGGGFLLDPVGFIKETADDTIEASLDADFQAEVEAKAEEFDGF